MLFPTEFRISYPPGYEIAFNEEQIQETLPALIAEQNFIYSSKKRKGYNCFAYAVGEENKDIDMTSFSKRFDISKAGLSKDPLDHTIEGYIKLLRGFYQFEVCEDGELEAEFTKIVLYEGVSPEDKEIGFSHIALQLKNGMWRSKLGTWEDITHLAPETIEGDYYGRPVVYMKHPDHIKINIF